MLTCTGGAPPLVARVRAPVCPSLATPRGVQYPVEGCDNVNMGAFSWLNAAMLQISAHPLVRAQSNVHRPWALFRETTVVQVLNPLVYHHVHFDGVVCLERTSISQDTKLFPVSG